MGVIFKSGERGIRTLEELSPLTVFKTAAFNHSAISPLYVRPTGGSGRSFVAEIVTEVTRNVHSSYDRLEEMEPAVRAVSWEAPQHHHVEKGNDWFLALLIIVGALVVMAVIFNNVLFALLLGIAGGVLAMSAAKRPAIVPYAVTIRGVKVEDELFPYANLVAFHIDEEDHRGPQLLIKTNRRSVPLLVLPIPVNHIDDIESMLKEKMPEELIFEPLGLKLLELFGF
jgi:hypothetical protein